MISMTSAGGLLSAPTASAAKLAYIERTDHRTFRKRSRQWNALLGRGDRLPMYDRANVLSATLARSLGQSYQALELIGFDVLPIGACRRSPSTGAAECRASSDIIREAVLIA